MLIQPESRGESTSAVGEGLIRREGPLNPLHRGLREEDCAAAQCRWARACGRDGMTLKQRLWAGALALACCASIASAAAADAPAALSIDDARAYSAAFEATDRGDFA